MAIKKERISEVIKTFGKNETDSGSAEVQIALMSEQINLLNQHLQVHKKDHGARRALLVLVGKRRGLLDYLAKNNIDSYQKVITSLKLRK